MCHRPCFPDYAYLDITSLETLICQTGGQAGWLWPGPVLVYFEACGHVPHIVPLSSPLSPLCVRVSVCRLQTDQLFSWAQHQSADRSLSLVWWTKQEADRLSSNDLSKLAKAQVNFCAECFTALIHKLQKQDFFL